MRRGAAVNDNAGGAPGAQRAVGEQMQTFICDGTRLGGDDGDEVVCAWGSVVIAEHCTVYRLVGSLWWRRDVCVPGDVEEYFEALGNGDETGAKFHH